MKLLVIAVVAMLFQQSLSYMSSMVLSVAAPAISADLGLPTSLVGVYFTLLYGTAIFTALMAGAFIARWGALRIAQVAMGLMVLGLGLGALGHGLTFALGAVVIGIGSSISTPASSVILFRYATAQQAPLVFSIKQTGVPVGGMIAGLLVPFVIALADWRAAFIVCAAICLAAVFLLQPLRREFDNGPRSARLGAPWRDAAQTLRGMLGTRRLREICLGFLAFVGVQVCFAALFVSYMVKEIGLGLAEAGAIFSGAQVVSIGARILWGWIAGRFASPRTVLGFLGVGMAAAAALMAASGAHWPIILITATAIAYAATAVSFHGVMLAEVARLAPEGKVGSYTGGIISFAGAGQSIYPAVFGVLLAYTGSFSYGFFAAALPALVSGVLFFRKAGE